MSLARKLRRFVRGKPIVTVTMREAIESQEWFADQLEGESWAFWRVLLLAIAGEPLTDAERMLFESVTGREREPGRIVEDFWAIVGRRGGKSKATSILAAWLAACVDWRPVLALGEIGTLPVLAASKEQAATAFEYITALFDDVPLLAERVANRTADTLELTGSVRIVVKSANFRTIRSITAIGALLDEVSSWRSDDGSRNPDREIVRSLRPSLMTTGGPLIAISSPLGRTGELYSAWKRHFGPSGDSLKLVAHASSKKMNSELEQWRIDRAYQEDPEAAAAEYGAEWRDSVSSFIGREALEAHVPSGVTVRAPRAGGHYVATCDPSGGRHDSMTLAIAHREGDRAVLDCVVEKRPPLSPDQTAGEFVEVLKQYRVSKIIGDAYGGNFPPDSFVKRGVSYELAKRTRSEAYLSFLPLLNSGRVELLDNERMVSQFAGLERKVGPSGREMVDHVRGQHDDVANVVALALTEAISSAGELRIDDDLLRWASTPARGSLGALLGHAQAHGSRMWLPDKFIPHA